MPVDFACDGCGQRFSVGWHHHHDLASGYGSSTLCVCAQCATQHRLEHAMDASKWPSSSSFFHATILEVPSAARLALTSRLREVRRLAPRDAIDLVNSPPILLGHDLPEHHATELKAEYDALGALVTLTRTREENVPAPDQQYDQLFVAEACTDDTGPAWRALDVRGSVEGVTGVFRLAEQVCGRCSAIGSLVTEWNQVPQTCPRCHSSIQQTGGWVT